uniref:Outer membrane protein beta-barrel domain-containing protein n=1 Tax=uncultured Elusimicrobia bacterium TaxID=699876 RepID=A0A650ENT8_9BACT|nr:hypothetical protein Elusimicrob2101_1410 [uncultured Elusimicrobia bacterium]
MKKVLVLIFALFAFAPFAKASSNIADDFRNHFGAASDLAAYNKDINALIGIADFHTGRGTTFPGFDIGATMTAVKPSSNNNISSEDYIYTGFLSAETKIPVVGLGVVVRGTDMNGFESLGGGLKYNFSLLDTVHFALGAFYDRAKTDWYTQDHYSASASASMNVLFLTPYVGVGYDYGEIETRGFTHNRSSSDGAARYTAGVNFKPFPFVYVFAAYTKTAGNEGFQGGLGLNF